jgi:hypothetical protein
MISESDRHQLYSRLESVLGAPEASTLMGYLPPLGGDVATKDDLRVLRAEMAVGFSQVETKIAEVNGSLRHQNRNLFMSMLTLQLSAFGLFVAAANLT